MIIVIVIVFTGFMKLVDIDINLSLDIIFYGTDEKSSLTQNLFFFEMTDRSKK
jgi:hypothetical protein